MKLKHSLNALLLIVAFITPLLLKASPLFRIGENSSVSWNQAITDGSIQAAPDALSGGAAQQFYANQIGINGVTNIVAANDTQITAFGPVSDGSTEHDSLVMSWDLNNNFQPNDLVVAAWDYVYGVDPDLTGTKVHFSAFPPPGVWDLSLELFDIFGNTRGWFAFAPVNAWANYWIDPSIIGIQGPFGAFHQDPGFDLTQVISIRLNESSMGGTSFIDIDPTTGINNPWNAWNHLSVIPTPPLFWVLASGLMAFFFFVKRGNFNTSL